MITVVAIVTIFQALRNVHTSQCKVLGAEHIVYMSYIQPTVFLNVSMTYI
jgi:ABC-type uncharacterized transport system permease subunit